MGKLQINHPDKVETIDVYLDPVKHPVAFAAKVDELIGCGMTKEEAERDVLNTPFEMELYYSKDQGLFLVESEFIAYNEVYNPYDGKAIENPLENLQ